MTSIKDKQDLRDKAQTYLYTCSSNAEFVQYLSRNKKQIQNYTIQNGLAQRREDQNKSQKQMMKFNVDRYVHAFKLSKLMKQPDMVFRKADYYFMLMGITLNTAAFLNTIEMLGNDQQVDMWRKLVLNGQAFGGYGQTQLGHGSNVQGLQLQAHYDQKKQIFRFNSPTVTSAKFWPGVLGQVCTHSVVQAKTFVKGKSIGIQTFVFQVRDQNLQPIKGVKSGDIGPKFGFHRVDNGYLLVDNVQVPRDCMLMRYVQVTPEGQVLGRQNKQAVKYAYGSMLYLRVALPFSFAFGHMIAPSRQLYALYQRMGVQNQPQYKKQIVKYICTGKGFIVANMFAQKLFTIFSNQLKQKNFQKADKVLVKCHITSSTFKALSSWKALKICTQIATRNNFCTFRTTYIPYAFNNIVPSVTYEGDNSVLLQQTARFILMKDKGQQLEKPQTNLRDDNIPAVIKMLKYVTSMQVRRLKKLFQGQFESGVDMKKFWNEKYQRDIIQVSKLWGVLQLVQGFQDTLKDMTAQLKPYFSKIGKVFTKTLLGDTPQIYTYGFVIEQSQPWKQFTDDQFWALVNMQRPISIQNQEHKLIEREGSWMRSRL